MDALSNVVQTVVEVDSRPAGWNSDTLFSDVSWVSPVVVCINILPYVVEAVERVEYVESDLEVRHS